MPIALSCPNGHELIAQDHQAGRKLRCPQCQATLIIPDAAPETSAPQRKKRKGAAKSQPTAARHPMARVRLGLAFYYSKILSYLLFIVLGLLGPFLFGLLVLAAGRRVGAILWDIFPFVLLLFAALSPAAGIKASILCLAGMPRVRGRGVLALSLLFDLASFALMLWGAYLISGQSIDDPLALRTPALVPLSLGSLASVLAWVCFLLFLRRLAILLEGENAVAAEQPFILMLFGLGLLLAPLAIVGVTWFIATTRDYREAAPFVFYLLYLGWIVGYVKFLVSNLNLLAHLRQAIQDRLPK